MDEIEVRLVKLEPMRIICFNGFGKEPESLAYSKMIAWAKAKGLFTDGKEHRFFGYNNPDPTPGSPNYGYDVWVSVDETIQPDGEARLIEFTSGLYAVTRCEVHNPWEDIPAAWKKLVNWVEHSKYRCTTHLCLEEHIGVETLEGGEFTLDLFLPIVE